MKCRTQLALGVGAGYLLGRTHKTKLALGLAAVAATGKFGGVSGQLIKRGSQLIGSTDALGKLAPQLTEVTDLIRNDLMDAGKAAALAAVRGRIDSLSDTIQDRADSLREGKLPGADDLPGGKGKPRRRRGAEEDEEDRPRRRRGGDARRRRDEEEPADDEDAEDFDDTADEDEPERDEEEPEPDEEEPDRDEEEPEPVRDEDEPERDEEEPEEDEPARPRRRTASSGGRRTRSAAGSAPVRRARR